MFQCTRQLSKLQLQELDQLMQLCQTIDGGTPSIYRPLLGQKRDTENSVLYYKDKKLAGFLGAYFFYEDACEISLLIAPGQRRQGIARHLLKTIFPLLLYKDMAKLIFSTSPAYGEKWLPAKEFTYQHSEYHMERDGFEIPLISKPSLTLREASIEDLSLLCTLDEACFPVENVNMIERFTYLLNHADYTIVLASHNDSIIGKAHIHWQEENTLLSDIAIHPTYQGKGFGSELLAHCIRQALRQKNVKLALDVEASNKNALRLYLKHGFETKKSYDYWFIPIEKMQSTLIPRR